MENRGSELASVTIVFLVSSWLFVGLRIFTRIRLVKSVGADDWFLVLTLILFSCYSSIGLYGVSHGTGKCAVDMTPQQFIVTSKIWWLAELFYAITTCVLKLSIGFFLLRVARKKTHIYPIWGVMILSLIYGTYMFFFVIFQCWPSSYFWNKAQKGYCVSPELTTNSTYGYAAVIALTDWTFGLLPAFIVYDLQMDRRTKILACMLLCAANVGGIASLVRITYIHQLSTTKDFSSATVGLAISSTIEPGISIAAASIAALGPLVYSFYSKIESSRSRSRATPLLRKIGKHPRLELLEASPIRASAEPLPPILGASSPRRGESSWIRREMDGALRPNGEVELISNEASYV